MAGRIRGSSHSGRTLWSLGDLGNVWIELNHAGGVFGSDVDFANDPD